MGCIETFHAAYRRNAWTETSSCFLPVQFLFLCFLLPSLLPGTATSIFSFLRFFLLIFPFLQVSPFFLQFFVIICEHAFIPLLLLVIFCSLIVYHVHNSCGPNWSSTQLSSNSCFSLSLLKRLR